MSATAERIGCCGPAPSPLASTSRRTGVSGTRVSATSPANAATAATEMAAPAETAPTTAPATPGPMA